MKDRHGRGWMKAEFLLPADIEYLEAFGEGHTAASFVDLKRNPRLPPVYFSGVLYKLVPNPIGWQLPSQTIKRRYADCKDLAAYRAAELRREGIPAQMAIIPSTRHEGSFHAIVRWPDGTLEDPSRVIVDINRGWVDPERVYDLLDYELNRGHLALDDVLEGVC